MQGEGEDSFLVPFPLLAMSLPRFVSSQRSDKSSEAEGKETEERDEESKVETAGEEEEGDCMLTKTKDRASVCL